jgi:hypothetical protein
MNVVSSEVLLRPDDFSVGDVSLVISACSIANFYVPDLFTIFSTKVKDEVESISKNSIYYGHWEDAGYMKLHWEPDIEREKRYFNEIKKRGEAKLLTSDFNLIPWHKFRKEDFFLPVGEDRLKYSYIDSPWKYHFNVDENLKPRIDAITKKLDILKRSGSASNEFILSMEERIRQIVEISSFPPSDKVVLPKDEFDLIDPVEQAVENAYSQFFGKLTNLEEKLRNVKDPLNSDNEKAFERFAIDVISKGYSYEPKFIENRVEFIPDKSKDFIKLDRMARKSLRKQETPLSDPLESELYFLYLFRGFDAMANWSEHPDIQDALDSLLSITVANLEHFRPESVGNALMAYIRRGLPANHVLFLKGELALLHKIEIYEKYLEADSALMPFETDGVMRIFRGVSGYDYNISDETCEKMIDFACRVGFSSRDAIVDLAIGLAGYLRRNSGSRSSTYDNALNTLKVVLSHLSFLSPESMYLWKHSTFKEMFEGLIAIEDLIPEYVQLLREKFVEDVNHFFKQHQFQHGEMSSGSDALWILKYLESDFGKTIEDASSIRWTLMDSLSRSAKKIAPIYRMKLSSFILKQDNVPVKELMLVKEMMKDSAWNPANLSESDLRSFADVFCQYAEKAKMSPISLQEMKRAALHIVTRQGTLNNDYVPSLLSAFARNGFKSKEISHLLEESLSSEDPDASVQLKKFSLQGLISMLSFAHGEYADLIGDSSRETVAKELLQRLESKRERDLDVIDPETWIKLAHSLKVCSGSKKSNSDIGKLFDITLDQMFFKPDVFDSDNLSEMAEIESGLQ